MTPDQFDEFIWEIIPSALFHVEDTDKHDESGACLSEVILVRLIANTPECLTYRPLQWFIDNYVPVSHNVKRLQPMRKSLEEQQEEQELQSQEQAEQAFWDMEASVQMDAAFQDHLQQQIDEQMAAERLILEAKMRTCGKPPEDLFVDASSASHSSEEQLFHQILSDERDANSKIRYK